MKRVIRKLIVTSALLGAVVGISGCATAARSVDTSDASAMSVSAGETVVFGKFRLLRNGEDVRLDDGVFGTSAALRISQVGDARETVSPVREHGEFAVALEPGLYRVSSISFNNRGERVEPITNFLFQVGEGEEAVYIGTVTIEATFDAGYYGVSGVVDSYSVSNDCARDCAARLERLGLANASVSLMQQPDSRFASTN